jgi:hypothetical protein
MIYISHHILKKWLVIAPSDDPRWNLNACGWRQWIASSRHPQRAPGVNVCRVSGAYHRSFFESFGILIILYIYIIYLFIIIYSYLLLSIIICYYIILCHIILYYIIWLLCRSNINEMFFPHPQGSFCRATGIVHFSGMAETLENLQEKNKVSCRICHFSL